MLTKDDPRYWFPLHEVRNYVSSLIPEGAKVLEIGAYHVPFERSTHFVDYFYDPKVDNVVCDVTCERLPFEDKSFDFVYCRHVVEDLVYPHLALREMSRVAKAGYIETPSVAAELCRGIDASSPPWRGFHHHNWFVTSEDGELKLIRKYPLVEYQEFDEELITQMLRYPIYWNSYLLWQDEIPWSEIEAHPLHARDAIAAAMQSGFVSANAFAAEIGASKRHQAA
jgi:hypothetical protein